MWFRGYSTQQTYSSILVYKCICVLMESQLICMIQRIYVGLYFTHTNMSIHICGPLIKLSMLTGMGACVRSCCESTLRVCMCVFWSWGWPFWLPEATALSVWNEGVVNGEPLAMLAVKNVCVCVYTCVSHTYRTYVKFTDTFADVSDTEPAGPLHQFPPPRHGTVLH